MKGSGGDAVAHAESAEPAAELARRLARERQGEHVLGVGAAGCDAVGDAPRERTRLARSGAGQDAQGSGVGRDRVALTRVEPLEQRVRVHASDRIDGV